MYQGCLRHRREQLAWTCSTSATAILCLQSETLIPSICTLYHTWIPPYVVFVEYWGFVGSQVNRVHHLYEQLLCGTISSLVKVQALLWDIGMGNIEFNLRYVRPSQSETRGPRASPVLEQWKLFSFSTSLTPFANLTASQTTSLELLEMIIDC